MIESVISIFILSLIAVLAISIHPFIEKSQSDSRENVIDYQLFLKEIESDKFNFVLKDVSSSEVYLYSKTNKKEYKLKQSKQSLILSGEKSGYLPMLDKIRSVFFSKSGHHFAINVSFINGEQYTNVSVIKNEK
ncbi:MAG: ComGF family competence protein [Apilactobacillus sp.]|nr:ComGF family competence protein [Apilactobacillus sp.]MCT6822805.1 ComGF family competence protein [Apilactobacillus sp.]MCT6857870.1 ComGF family competence protein [Apilactobacillus sp.]